MSEWRRVAIGILHADPREQEISLAERLDKNGARVDLLDVRDLVPTSCTRYDAVLNRVYPSTAFQQSKVVLDRTTAVVRELDQLGVFVVSGLLSTLADYSKLLAAQLMDLQGVRTPRTYALTPDMADSPPFLPLVVKPEIGAFGADCVKIDTEEAWRATVASCDFGRSWIVQQYARPLGDVDYRITVMFGEVPFAFQRRVVGGWFRNNEGPSVITPAEALPREAIDLAVRASAAVGALVNGVDLVIDERGATIIENNPTLSFSPKSWKIDVLADRLHAFVARRARDLASSRVALA